MKTFNMEAALRHRFRPPEFAILFEVRNGTGFQRRVRSADAIAMQLYPSRGLTIIGIECKASRGDWLNELKQPDKSVELQRYCDQWYVAVEDEKIVGPGELPATWGLMIPRGNKLTVKVEAPALKPEAIDRLFLASMMRNASLHCSDAEAIAGAVRIEREAQNARFREEIKEVQLRTSRDYQSLSEAVRTFESASGISIRHTWDASKIGAAVKFVQDGGLEKSRKDLERLATSADSIAASIRNAISTIPPVQQSEQCRLPET